MPPVSAAEGPSRLLPRWLLLITAALLVARIATGVIEARNAPKGGELVEWVDLARAAATAKRMHRPILYEFGAAWCGPCNTMAAEVFADRASAETIAGLVVPVKVTDRRREDGRNAPVVDSLQRAFGVEAFPTLVVVWPGSPKFESLAGYRGRDATMHWITQSAGMARIRALGALPDSTPRVR